jgi:hypothetical protein
VTTSPTPNLRESEALIRFPPTQWDPEKFSHLLYELVRLLIEAREQRARQAAGGRLGLLGWSRQFLPGHFTREPSLMHRWLTAELDRMPEDRGVKLNVIGPRGGAKSTIGSLA